MIDEDDIEIRTFMKNINLMIKRNVLKEYKCSTAIDFKAENIILNAILKGTTPYADKHKRLSTYTNDDILAVKYAFEVCLREVEMYKANGMDRIIILRILRLTIQNIKEDNLNNPDKKILDYGDTKTFYMLQNMIKDGIIETREFKDRNNKKQIEIIGVNTHNPQPQDTNTTEPVFNDDEEELYTQEQLDKFMKENNIKE